MDLLIWHLILPQNAKTTIHFNWPFLYGSFFAWQRLFRHGCIIQYNLSIKRKILRQFINKSIRAWTLGAKLWCSKSNPSTNRMCIRIADVIELTVHITNSVLNPSHENIIENRNLEHFHLHNFTMYSGIPLTDQEKKYVVRKFQNIKRNRAPTDSAQFRILLTPTFAAIRHN